jgi:hypothetical protein
MIPRVKMALLSTLIGTSLYASNFDSTTQGFIGLELGYATIEGHTVDIFNENQNIAFQESSDIKYGLHLGAQNEDWRITVGFNYYDNSSDDQNMEQLQARADYFFVDDLDATIRPYIGANIGFANYESTFVDESGFTYGGQAGLLIKSNEALDIDLSYRYLLGEVEALNHMGSVNLGLNYIY